MLSSIERLSQEPLPFDDQAAALYGLVPAVLTASEWNNVQTDDARAKLN
jgi:hypothetical protein